MAIYWKTLIGYGFIFWIILCATDFLGFMNIRQYKNNIDSFIPKPKEIYDRLEEKINSDKTTTSTSNTSVLKFGWNLVFWNSLTFAFSIFICSVFRTIFCMSWSFYRKLMYKNNTTQVRPYPSTDRCFKTVSKIPVMVKSSSILATRSSDINLNVKPTPLDSEKSCPNLTATARSTSNLSTICKTIFKNETMFNGNINSENYEKQLEARCQRLKEELLKIQANSLKEHAVLSRKLDTLTKEKRELNKQLAQVQKENRAAKQQMEELLQEKSVLVKRLENATKEFKCNTKSKKFALAKLEEVSCNMENLRQQLEQVSRDKEILEKKLKLLENEYNKLHERYISVSHNATGGAFHNNDNKPERDVDVRNIHQNCEENVISCSSQSAQKIQAVGVIASVSQTELDMKKIQMKIKQLEKNLETFNSNQHQIECVQYSDSDREHEPSDISLSLRGITTDSQAEDDESPSESMAVSERGTRYRNWAGKVGDFFSKSEQFSKIQALASKMHDKVCQLENIRERTESIDGNETENELADFSSTEEMTNVPNKIVSNSLAFKNFLKSLNAAESMKKQCHSRAQSEVGYF